MGKNLAKAFVWFAVHAIAFFLLVWILLGMSPMDTYGQMANRFLSIKNGTFAFSQSVAKTGRSMGKVGNHHLNEMNDRINGKDPYQDYNNSLDSKVRNDFGR